MTVGEFIPFCREAPFANFGKDYPVEIVEPLPNQYALDVEKVKFWVEFHQDPECREVAKKVAQCFKRITYGEWINALQKVCYQFLEQISASPYALVMRSDAQNKSEPWVALHALRWLEPQAIIPTEGVERFCQSHTQMTLLYLDDAAYTGNSLADTLLFGVISEGVNIYIGIPYCTRQAFDLLSLEGIVIKGELLDTLEDLLDEKSLDYLTYSGPYYPQTPAGGEFCLSYLQHKIPDEVSGWPDVLKKGRGLRGCFTGLALVEGSEVPPPYKWNR
jgi:hypothetical protein